MRKSFKQNGLIFLLSGMLIFSANAQQVPAGDKADADSALAMPVIITQPLPAYDYSNLDYAMARGFDMTPKGRIWALWVAGGDNADAFIVLASSDNKGKTWSKPRFVIDPHDSTLQNKRRTRVSTLWTDPSGRLWLFFDQVMSNFDGRAGTWYTICENPDSKDPVWSTPVRIWHGCVLNKPTVLSNGEWLLPVSLWHRSMISMPYRTAFQELDNFRMANVFVSADQGKSWSRRGGVKYEKPDFDEHQFIERKDGSIWMITRTQPGIFESFSYDKGKTWTEPTPSPIAHISSRHFIRRLSSGNLLLVKHGPSISTKTKGRSQLSAFISDDDGKTWKGSLMLDERRGVSYPDGFQAPDGMIYISYDRSREFDGEILFATFREEDVLQGRFVTRGAKGKRLISRPGAIESVRVK